MWTHQRPHLSYLVSKLQSPTRHHTTLLLQWQRGASGRISSRGALQLEFAFALDGLRVLGASYAKGVISGWEIYVKRWWIEVAEDEEVEERAGLFENCISHQDKVAPKDVTSTMASAIRKSS
jgi:hypothetical protein